MRSRRIRIAATVVAVVALGLVACDSDSSTPQDDESTAPDTGTEESDSPDADSEASDAEFPIVIEHALGTTTIPERPERVATVAWANHEVPLALGIVPVGMAAANFGDDDNNGTLPWVEEKLAELGVDTPVLFDETDGIDFEAVNDTNPDVILAPYSGLSESDYATLSDIAPVIAYPEQPWATSWRDSIRLSSTALGLQAEGDQLIADLEQEIADTVAQYEGLEGTATMFLTHVDTTDLSQVNFYTTHDTRAAFFEDLGLSTPGSIAELSAGTDQFALSVSAEQVDQFADVEIIVTYGGADLVEVLEADPLLSQMPAVANGAIVSLPGDQPLGTAANPTPLAISWILDDYVTLLADAAAKGQ